jgi:hypothetical protein
MRHLIHSWRERVADIGFVWLYERNVVGHFEKIPLVSMVEDSAPYVRVSSAALNLIRDYDPKRFQRVVDQTRWLVDSAHSGGPFSGTYQHRIKATQIDFKLDYSVGDELFHAAYFAGVIVHEATHGMIRDRGISTTPENRIQVERICRAEENRFLGLLRRSIPDLPGKLIRPFDPSDWHESWNSSRLRKALKELARIDQKHESEQAAPSNGG